MGGTLAFEASSHNVTIRLASTDTRGEMWNETSLMPLPPLTGFIGLPGNTWMTSSGDVKVCANSDDVSYFSGRAPSPFTWSTPQLVLQRIGVNSSGYDFTSLAVMESPNVSLILGSETRSDFAGRLWYRRTLDDGLTWSPYMQLGPSTIKGGTLAVGPDEVLYASWVDYALGKVVMARWSDQGASLLPDGLPVADILDNLAMRPIGWTAASDVNLVSLRIYPVYNEINRFAANFPGLAVDRSNGPHRGRVYSVWAEHSAGEPAAATAVIPEVEPNDTPEQAQLIPVDCTVSGSIADVHRPTSSDYVAFDLVKGETIWIGGIAFLHLRGWVLEMQMPDGSLRIIEDQSLKTGAAGEGIPKPTIFNAPRTGRYYLHIFPGITSTGYLLRVRHWLPSSGTVALDMRDIVLTYSDDGGQTWAPKRRVNHDPAGTDQAMPNVAVDGLGRVYVGWYDWRNAVEGDGMNAYATISLDGGETFQPDMRLSSQSSMLLTGTSPDGYIKAGHLVGDRIAVAAGDDYGLVAWTDLRRWPSGSDIHVARLAPDLPTATDAVSDLAAEPLAAGVRLRWLVNDARSVSGLRVYRSESGGAEIALGDGDLMPAGDGRAEWFDADAQPGHSYDYRLRVVTGTGTHWLGPVSIEVPQRITSLTWRAAWPNPFARRTSVKLAVPRAAQGSVRVYDVQGKQVATLAEGAFEPGERTIEWDGRDAAGGVSAPGLYFVAAQVGSEAVRLRVARVP